jgi:hypothetical protein
MRMTHDQAGRWLVWLGFALAADLAFLTVIILAKMMGL